MNEYGGFRVARTLPKYVEDQVKCMRTDPWPGVHAAAVINNKFTSNFVGKSKPQQVANNNKNKCLLYALL